MYAIAFVFGKRFCSSVAILYKLFLDVMRHVFFFLKNLDIGGVENVCVIAFVFTKCIFVFEV